MAMRTDFCEQLKQIHDELGIERVRFHGIFSDDVNIKHKSASCSKEDIHDHAKVITI